MIYFIIFFDSVEVSFIIYCMCCVEYCCDLFNKWFIKKNISEMGEIIFK